MANARAWSVLSGLKNIQWSGDRKFRASCPAHRDANPSLSVELTDDGKVLLFCHGHCTWEAVTGAVGLTGQDLFPPKTEKRGKLLRTVRYEIRDVEGVLKATHVRREYEGGSKSMPWEPPGVKTRELPLYGIERTANLPDGTKIILTEGEKAAASLIARGFNAVGTVCGAAAVPSDESLSPLSRFWLALWPDNDTAGIDHMEKISSRLHLLGVKTFWITWPEAPPGGDAADFIGNFAELLKIDLSIPGHAINPDGKEKNKSDSDSLRPAICVTGRTLDELTADAWSAIERRNNPVSIVVGNSDQLLRIVGYKAEQIGVYHMQYEIAEAARWEKLARGEPVPVFPPIDVSRNMLHQRIYPVPKLRRLVSHWLLSAAGEILTTAGYHLESGIYLTESFTPQPMNVETAVGIFDELLKDFHWAHSSDRAHAFSLMLLPFVREYIRGETPFYIVHAPQPGVGKSLLLRVLLSIAGIKDNFLFPQERENAGALRVQIESNFLQESETILIDNVTAEFDSDWLSGLATSSTFQIRRFYTQSTMDVPQRMIWAMTVNNPIFTEQIIRRTCRIKIEATQPIPWLRTDIADDELYETVKRRRPELASAAYAIVDQWIKEGRPEEKPKDAVLGSFTHWNRVMNGLLHIAKIEDFGVRYDEEMPSRRNRDDLTKFFQLWADETETRERRNEYRDNEKEYEDLWFKATDLVAFAVDTYLGNSDKLNSRGYYLSRILNKRLDQPFFILDEQKFNNNGKTQQSLRQYRIRHKSLNGYSLFRLFG